MAALAYFNEPEAFSAELAITTEPPARRFAHEG
jgi:hypothetical protein